jgi:hypothetical protein
LRTLLVATTTGAAGIRVFAGVQDFHFSCYHLGGVLFLAILTFPTASLETTLDIDLTALPQVLVTDLRQLTPHNNAMPLCFFLAIAGIVGPILIGCHVEIGNSGSTRGVSQFWVCPDISNENYLVHTSACHTEPPLNYQKQQFTDHGTIPLYVKSQPNIVLLMGFVKRNKGGEMLSAFAWGRTFPINPNYSHFVGQNVTF